MKRKIKLGYMDYFLANSPKYLECHKEIKQELISEQKKRPPDECACCMFFKWTFGYNNELYGQCAVKPEINKEEFYKNKIPDECPLK